MIASLSARRGWWWRKTERKVWRSRPSSSTEQVSSCPATQMSSRIPRARAATHGGGDPSPAAGHRWWRSKQGLWRKCAIAVASPAALTFQQCTVDLRQRGRGARIMDDWATGQEATVRATWTAAHAPHPSPLPLCPPPRATHLCAIAGVAQRDADASVAGRGVPPAALGLGAAAIRSPPVPTLRPSR